MGNLRKLARQASVDGQRNLRDDDVAGARVEDTRDELGRRAESHLEERLEGTCLAGLEVQNVADDYAGLGEAMARK